MDKGLGELGLQDQELAAGLGSEGDTKARGRARGREPLRLHYLSRANFDHSIHSLFCEGCSLGKISEGPAVTPLKPRLLPAIDEFTELVTEAALISHCGLGFLRMSDRH